MIYDYTIDILMKLSLKLSHLCVVTKSFYIKPSTTIIILPSPHFVDTNKHIAYYAVNSNLVSHNKPRNLNGGLLEIENGGT